MTKSSTPACGQLDRRAEAGEAGADDQRGVGCGVLAMRQAAGSWVSSLNQVGTGGSSGRGYRSDSHTIELATQVVGVARLVTTAGVAPQEPVGRYPPGVSRRGRRAP